MPELFGWCRGCPPSEKMFRVVPFYEVIQGFDQCFECNRYSKASHLSQNDLWYHHQFGQYACSQSRDAYWYSLVFYMYGEGL